MRRVKREAELTFTASRSSSLLRELKLNLTTIGDYQCRASLVDVWELTIVDQVAVFEPLVKLPILLSIYSPSP